MAEILVVDDEEKMRHLLSIMLERRGHSISQAEDGVKAFDMVRANSYDMVITDMKMPNMDGIGLLHRIQSHKLSCPVVFITAFATIDSAVEAMREGAADYITKPFEEERIMLAVERTLNLSRVMAENRTLRGKLRMAEGNDEIVYTSKAMAEVVEMASRVAETETAVLIKGESGTGKELLARFIHRVSPRRDNRFVPVNCAAISPNLVESELFGHEKGAFTGADRKTAGKFEYASGGTLFLDEIGDLPMEAQAKLLRALQEKRFHRVGGNEEISVDVRVICATNRDLRKCVESGDFRQDLYFRINVFPLRVPSLRERKEDILALSRFFLRRFCREETMEITDSAITTLMEHTWPGNVRELANAMERAVILVGDKGEINARVLSFIQTDSLITAKDAVFRLPAEGICLESVEKDFVNQALSASGNNQTAAAKLLGLSRAKFRVLMKQAKNDDQGKNN